MKRGILDEAAVLIRPGNLGKSIASLVPLAGEFINQIEGHRLDQKLDRMDNEIEALKKQAILTVQSNDSPQLQDWPMAVGDFKLRTVDFTVVYDAGFHSPAERGREMFQSVTQGCLINNQEIMTSIEAFFFAQRIAKMKHGKLVIIAGMGFYEFKAEPPDDLSGLVKCKLGRLDQVKWNQWQGDMAKNGLPVVELPPLLKPVAFKLQPFLGEEIGFLHTGEARDVMRGTHHFSATQFEKASISHFKFPSRDCIKVFVSTTLGSRILNTGAPVFNAFSELLGFISDVENYENDFGRRIVVRTLLGNPSFM